MTELTLPQAKARAKSLRADLATQGHAISHAQALELVARQNGARDWNTLHALLAKAEKPLFHVGQSLSGRYLGQRFTGRLLSVSAAGDRFFDLTIRFDEPVDVVTFASFSALRRQIRCKVDRAGISPQKTSNGEPHVVLDIG